MKGHRELHEHLPWHQPAYGFSEAESGITTHLEDKAV